MVLILRFFRLIFFLVVASLPLSAAAAAALDAKIAPDVDSFMLDNGLQVVVIPDHRAPVVTHMIWYKAGSVEDPPGKSGIAHFLEHLMFKGTSNRPQGEFQTLVTELGGNQNAFTSYDYTAYHQTVSREHLGLMMELEADRMANLIIDEAAIATEREVIIEERRSRVDNSPGSRLAEAVNAALFQNSRYGVPIIGWAHEMAALDLADARDFYDRYYTPNNAVLVIAGDVTSSEVRRLAEATYGKVVRRADPPPRIHPSEPPPLAARSVTLADPQVTLPSFQRVYLVPSYATAEPGEAEALDVLAEILGGGTTSRFYRTLVVDKGIAASAGVGYRGTALGDSNFGVYAAPRGEIDIETLAAAVDALIADLVENGITDEELTRAKRRIIAGAIYAQDNVSSLASVFGRALTTGGSIDDVRQWPAAIEAVSAADVDAAAREYLELKRSVTGRLVSEPEEGRT